MNLYSVSVYFYTDSHFLFCMYYHKYGLNFIIVHYRFQIILVINVSKKTIIIQKTSLTCGVNAQ